jgi:hypothetical protein
MGSLSLYNSVMNISRLASFKILFLNLTLMLLDSQQNARESMQKL